MIDFRVVKRRLDTVRGRIRAAGGDPDGVTVVAVTKGFGVEAVTAACAAGISDLGENYAQELLAKKSWADGARWHFLGRVQRNKVAALGDAVHLWQAVDRAVAGKTIARHAPGAAALVQVNVSGEPQKAGCPPSDAPAMVDQLREEGLRVLGLMAVGPHGPAEAARPGFRLLSSLADDLGLNERSMGMTDDLEVAVQEGATMVRLGRALFGPRPVASLARR